VVRSEITGKGTSAEIRDRRERRVWSTRQRKHTRGEHNDKHIDEYNLLWK
jgi:hypothetical protein